MPDQIDHLDQIDSLYEAVIKKLPAESRLAYCESLIDKMQLKLDKNRNLISAEMKEKLVSIIECARKEMREIVNETYKK